MLQKKKKKKKETILFYFFTSLSFEKTILFLQFFFLASNAADAFCSFSVPFSRRYIEGGGPKPGLLLLRRFWILDNIG